MSERFLKKIETFGLQVAITNDNIGHEIMLIGDLLDAVSNTVVRYGLSETVIHVFYRCEYDTAIIAPFVLWVGDYFSMDAAFIQEWVKDITFRVGGKLLVTLEGVVG